MQILYAHTCPILVFVLGLPMEGKILDHQNQVQAQAVENLSERLSSFSVRDQISNSDSPQVNFLLFWPDYTHMFLFRELEIPVLFCIFCCLCMYGIWPLISILFLEGGCWCVYVAFESETRRERGIRELFIDRLQTLN